MRLSESVRKFPTFHLSRLWPRSTVSSKRASIRCRLQHHNTKEIGKFQSTPSMILILTLPSLVAMMKISIKRGILRVSRFGWRLTKSSFLRSSSSWLPMRMRTSLMKIKTFWTSSLIRKNNIWIFDYSWTLTYIVNTLLLSHFLIQKIPTLLNRTRIVLLSKFCLM